MSNVVSFPQPAVRSEPVTNIEQEPTAVERQMIVDSIHRLQEELLAMRHHLVNTRLRLELTKAEVAKLPGAAQA
jgi:hypothetical protein